MLDNRRDLTDKVVVITGGSGGLGEQIAYACARQNARVVVCARRIDKLGKVKQNCEAISGKEAYAFQLDIANPEIIKEVVERIYDEVGTVDVLVNNAGFGFFEEALKFDMDIAEKMFRVNVLGMMYMTQLVALQMAERKVGHIINVASQAGKMATPKSSVYSATKFAVLGYSNALRLELKPLGIYLTTVNPGPIATNFFDIADKEGGYLDKVDRLVLDSEVVANRIVGVMGIPRRELNLPVLLEVASKFYTLFPHIGDYIAGNVFNNK